MDAIENISQSEYSVCLSILFTKSIFLFSLYRSKLVEHTDQTHTGELDCKECDYKCTELKTMFTHVAQYHEEGQFKCCKCDFVANLRHEVTSHRMYGHAQRKRTYLCEYCGDYFNDRQSVIDHCKSEHAEEGEEKLKQIAQTRISVKLLSLNCPVTGCGERIQLNSARSIIRFSLWQHLLQVHKIERYRCMVRGCAESFDNK